VREGDIGILFIFCVFALVSLQFEGSHERAYRNIPRSAYSSKWVPLFGSARLFASTFLTFLSGRTTMMGTGEFERQYFETLPTPGAPNAAPHACIMPRWPLVPTTIESGRYRAIKRSSVVVTLPAISSTMMESCNKHNEIVCRNDNDRLPSALDRTRYTSPESGA
jgi:hypothetical protein